MPMKCLQFCLMALLGAFVGIADAGDAVQTVSHGRFRQVPVQLPAGEPQRVVIWFADTSKEGGEKRQRYVQALRADGAMVAVVDVRDVQEALRKEGGECGFSSGDVENFSRYLQAYFHVPTYHLPVLLGDGAGSAWAYALAAQAPRQVLAGVATDGLCPSTVPAKTICGKGIAQDSGVLQPAMLPVPWLLATDVDERRMDCPAGAMTEFLQQVPQGRGLPRDAHGHLLPGLRAAVRSLADRKDMSLPPPPADLSGLPIVEVPAVTPGGDTFAIFVSGDGGWAGLDKQIAEALAQAGIPVVGMDSLRYFWSKRTPEGLAADLDRIVRFYARRWQRQRVLLIGFSQGADVLPAAINRLPTVTGQSVALTALLSVGRKADYEFHVSNWLGADNGGLPIAPEVLKLPPARTLCIYGQEDADALCPDLPADATQRFRLPGDHHFDGDYATVAKLILQHLHGLVR